MEERWHWPFSPSVYTLSSYHPIAPLRWIDQHFSPAGLHLESEEWRRAHLPVDWGCSAPSPCLRILSGITCPPTVRFMCRSAKPILIRLRIDPNQLDRRINNEGRSESLDLPLLTAPISSRLTSLVPFFISSSPSSNSVFLGGSTVRTPSCRAHMVGWSH